MLAYFTTVFVAAPAALITGLGMSPALSQRVYWLSKRLSIQHARSLHFVVLVYFLFFIAVHVTMVLTTNALRNLNHMFAARDGNSWLGFWIFAAAMVVTAAAWVWATPFTIRHPRVIQRVGYALVGPFQRMLEQLDPKPVAFTEPKRAEARKHDSDHEFEGVFWNPGERSVQDQTDQRHHEAGGNRTDRGGNQGVADRTERDHDEDHLDAFEHHSLETRGDPD